MKNSIAIYPHNGFMPIMFSAQVNGKFTTFNIASHTPFSGSMQAENGIRKTYSQAMKNAIGHARNHRIKNHNIAHNIPGHISAFPFPSPEPSPDPIFVLSKYQSVLFIF